MTPADFDALVEQARATGKPELLSSAIPYARFLGLDASYVDGEVLTTLRYTEQLIGDAGIPALHGGTLVALLESTALFAVLLDEETQTLPKTITLTVDYLRSARALDTKCRAQLVRKGRRIVVVAVTAFQDDPAKPVATAVVHVSIAG